MYVVSGIKQKQQLTSTSAVHGGTNFRAWLTDRLLELNVHFDLENQ